MLGRDNAIALDYIIQRSAEQRIRRPEEIEYRRN